MLKGKRTVSACSLSSCRIRAEALARAFNNRIWPCVWVPHRTSAEREDGMSNGIDDEEEFFDASPSPVEVEDESVFCQHHSSAATEAGRAKLYELLQQHAADDAIEVFYDVSEDAGLTDCGDTCLRDDERRSDQVHDICGAHAGCLLSDECCGVSRAPDSCGAAGDELMTSPAEQSSDTSINGEVAGCLEPQSGRDEQKQNDLDPSMICSSNCEGCNCSEREVENSREKPLDESGSDLQEVSNASTDEGVISLSPEQFEVEDHSATEGKIPSENGFDTVTDEITKEAAVLPSENFEIPEQIASGNNSEAEQEHSDAVSDSSRAPENVPSHEEEEDVNVAIKVSGDVDSSSPSSDSDVSKPTSPTSRLQVFEDESRPKILRSTSLKTGKTPPGTPSRKKIVRFADVLGLDLEDVRHIMTGDVPIIPSSAYTDLNLRGMDLPTCEPISETVEVSRRTSAGWKSMPGATATNVLYPMFAVPGQQPDFMDRVRAQGVCLETIMISEMSVQCTCKVMNYGFYKKVIARYTFNDWQSSHDIDATYISGSSNGETDNFAFSIFLSPQNKNVKFALKYEVNGREYWDNNRSQNYCLNYHGSFQMPHLPSPLWQHQFW